MAFKMRGFPMQQTSALKSNHDDDFDKLSDEEKLKRVMANDPTEDAMQKAQIQAKEHEKGMNIKPGSYSSDSEFKKEDPKNYAILKRLYNIGYPDDPYSPTGTP